MKGCAAGGIWVTPQEQQLLMQLTQRINQTQLQEKDEDAQNLLGRELGANPDAIYIMAQTMVVQNMALEQLKSQVVQLQQQLQQVRQQPAHATSFLGRLLGEHDQPPAPPPVQPQYQQPQQQGGWQPVPPGSQPQYQQAPPQYVQTQYAQPQYYGAPVGQPSFFRGAMQTAAGVAAGALAFEGVESLLHGGFGHYGGWGGPAMGMGPGMGFGGGFERPVEETVVNNYYDQPGQMGGGEHHVEHDFGAGGGQNLGSQQPYDGGERHFENTDGSGAVYSDADYTTTGTDASGADQNAGGFDQGTIDNGMAADSSLDNAQIDDSGSGFDDSSGGGFDDGGGGFDSGGGFDNSGDSGF
jgi:hypothetical protein